MRAYNHTHGAPLRARPRAHTHAQACARRNAVADYLQLRPQHAQVRLSDCTAMPSVASLGAMWRMRDAIYSLRCGDSGAGQMWLARCVSLDADDMTFKSRDFDAQQRRLSLRPFAGRLGSAAACFVCLFCPPRSVCLAQRRTPAHPLVCCSGCGVRKRARVARAIAELAQAAARQWRHDQCAFLRVHTHARVRWMEEQLPCAHARGPAVRHGMMWPWWAT